VEKEEGKTALEMPCGTVIKLERPRSEGVLSSAEVAFLREHNIPLAYDAMQIGWLPAATVDDFNVETGRKQSRPQPYSAIVQQPQFNALRPKYTLRSWEPYDAATFKALLDDPRVWTYLPEAYPDPLTLETAAALIELSNASNHHQVYAVLRDATIVGQVRLLYDVDDKDPAKAEVSYWLGHAYWGRGIGSDMVRIFTKRCFADNGGINTLIARVHRDNAGSFAILRKAGYGGDRPDPKDPDWMILSCSR